MNIEEESNENKIYTLEDRTEAFKEFGDVIIETKAIKLSKSDSSKETKFYLMNSYVLYSSPKYNEFIKSIRLSFDTRYDIDIDPNNSTMRKITFLKNDLTKSFLIDEVSCNKIHDVLKGKVNQVKFHENFKASKKLGRGSFAHVKKKVNLGIHGRKKGYQRVICSKSF